jgi:hypothetical protein
MPFSNGLFCVGLMKSLPPLPRVHLEHLVAGVGLSYKEIE